MCDRCTELEEEVAWLRSELGIRADAEQGNRLRSAFSVTPGEAAVLMRLYAAGGRLVTLSQLCQAAPSMDEAGERDDLRIMRVYVSRIRKKMGVGAILLAYGRGYSLSPEAQARVRSVVEIVAQRAA